MPTRWPNTRPPDGIEEVSKRNFEAETSNTEDLTRDKIRPRVLVARQMSSSSMYFFPNNRVGQFYDGPVGRNGTGLAYIVSDVLRK